MKPRDRDFISLYNALWYKDFPVAHGHEDIGRRAVWTTHIASVVKQCADLMGLFTYFESGNRTDAVIQKASRSNWAKVEWEWENPANKSVNELGKLAAASDDAETMIFIGYSCIGQKHSKNMIGSKHEKNMEKIALSWKDIDTLLLVFLVTFDYVGKGKERIRHFIELETHKFWGFGKHKTVRTQKALPWQVKDTKWEASII